MFKATFKPSFHVVPETLVIPGYPLIVGQDFGRNPWSLIGQVDHLGRLLIHMEVPATNMGLEKHIEENLRPKLFTDKFMSSQRHPSGRSIGDCERDDRRGDLLRRTQADGPPGVPGANERY